MDELHKKVQVVVLQRTKNNINLLLLQTKADRGEFWQNVTGSIEGDESWLAGAKRELLEETGLEGHVNQLDLTFTFHDRWNRDVEERVFVAEVFSSEVELCEAEHQDFKWIPVDEVKETHYKHKNNYESFIEAVRCLKS